MRLSLTLGILLLILFATWWFLDSWVEVRALAVLSGGSFITEAKGWPILTAFWPLLVSFGLAIAIFLSIIFGAFIGFAESADFDAATSKLIERAEKAEKNAQAAREELLKAQSEANANARANAQALLDEAKVIKNRAERFYNDTELDKAELSEAVRQAQAERDQMATHLIEVDSKRQKAEAFVIRFKRKAYRVEKDLTNFLNENVATGDMEDEYNVHHWRPMIDSILKPITIQTNKKMMAPTPDKSPPMRLARGLGQSPR